MEVHSLEAGLHEETGIIEQGKYGRLVGIPAPFHTSHSHSAVSEGEME